MRVSPIGFAANSIEEVLKAVLKECLNIIYIEN
jgi:hypothetical protein